MRHLLALLTLVFALVACDESTTAPVDTIPGPPNAPRLKVTVLTGTKDAPSDTPTVRIQWWYTDSVVIMTKQNLDSARFSFDMAPTGDTILPLRKIGASILTNPGGDTIKSSPLLGVYAMCINNSEYMVIDTTQHIYFKN